MLNVSQHLGTIVGWRGRGRHGGICLISHARRGWIRCSRLTRHVLQGHWLCTGRSQGGFQYSNSERPRCWLVSLWSTLWPEDPSHVGHNLQWCKCRWFEVVVVGRGFYFGICFGLCSIVSGIRSTQPRHPTHRRKQQHAGRDDAPA